MRFYLDLFMVFFRIGIFTLGGGYAMVPLIEREVVDKKGWMESHDFLDALAIAQSLPGPIAVNTSVFVGYKLRGILGSIVGALGTIMPSFLCMIVIVSFFVGIRKDPTVIAVFTGIRPAVAALIIASVWTLGSKAKLSWLTGALALAAAMAVWLAHVSPAWIVLAVAAVGAMFPLAAKKEAPAAPAAAAAEKPTIDADDAKFVDGDKKD